MQCCSRIWLKGSFSHCDRVLKCVITCTWVHMFWTRLKLLADPERSVSLPCSLRRHERRSGSPRPRLHTLYTVTPFHWALENIHVRVKSSAQKHARIDFKYAFPRLQNVVIVCAWLRENWLNSMILHLFYCKCLMKVMGLKLYVFYKLGVCKICFSSLLIRTYQLFADVLGQLFID